jgi:glycerol-3-phosphate O-acyltransferase/dihydroxyacetone phosphate acyltransferase
MRRLADRALHLVARIATIGWFRSVEVVGVHLIEPDHPTLIVANHPGGFIDPALLTAILPRAPRFLAMAALWRIWPIRPLLAFAGAIPVQRAQDGATGRNVDAFAAARRALGDGGIVGIFPEGQASDEPHLLPVKTGAARIVLGARASGVRRIRIVPVGLIYERKQTARTRAYVRVGTPIDLDGWLGTRSADPADHAAVARLTAEIGEGLGEAALDYRDAAQASELGYAATVYLRRPGGDPSWAPPLSAIDRVAGALADAPTASQARVREAVVSYRAALEVNDAADRQVAAGPRDVVRPARVVGGLLTLVALPFAVVGLIVNGVPALLVHLAGRRPAAPVTLATVKFLVGFVAFPATWLAWRYLAFAEASGPWLLTLVVGPLCGLVAAVVGDRLRRARLARLRPSRLAVPGRAAEDLAERRAWLVDEVDSALGGRQGNLAGSLDD